MIPVSVVASRSAPQGPATHIGQKYTNSPEETLTSSQITTFTETAISQGHEPLWPWLLPFDQTRFAGYLGSCATRLNLARTAIPALEGALGTGRTKQRALVLADLAANHRALGHADEARTLADEARAIGVEFGSEKVLRRLAA